MSGRKIQVWVGHDEFDGQDIYPYVIVEPGPERCPCGCPQIWLHGMWVCLHCDLDLVSA